MRFASSAVRRIARESPFAVRRIARDLAIEDTISVAMRGARATTCIDAALLVFQKVRKFGRNGLHRDTKVRTLSRLRLPMRLENLQPAGRCPRCSGR